MHSHTTTTTQRLLSYYGNEDDNDDGFTYDDYIPKTVDPGPWMLIGASLYSLLCLFVLPLFVVCGNRREKRRLDREEWNKTLIPQSKTQDEQDDDSISSGECTETKEELDHIGAVETELVEDRDRFKAIKIKTVSSRKAIQNDNKSKLPYHDALAYPNSAIGGVNASALSAASSAISSRSKRLRGGFGLLNYANLYLRASESEEIHEITHGSHIYGIHGHGTQEDRNYSNKDGTSTLYYRNGSDSKSDTFDDVRPEDAADANDPGKGPNLHETQEEVEEFSFCCGLNAMFSKRNFRYSYGVIADIAHIDKESKRLLQLGWPMTLSAGITALFEAISVAIIANFLGTETLIAYVVTGLLIGLTDTFLAGPSSALNTVCSHAIGANNNTLAGQYVQIAAVLYLMLGIPSLGVWYVWIGDVVRLMDLGEVADLASSYTKIVIWHYVLSGLFDGYNALLDITGYAAVGAVFDIVYGLFNLIALWISCVYWDGFDLIRYAFMELMISMVFFIAFTGLVAWNGWLSQFTEGMFKTFGLSNFSAVSNVVSTAIPLSFGSLLEYGEWEALTFFVAYLGEAEVAAWGLLESLWDFFEAATEGLSEAASIRVAYHLGRGNIKMAKMSSYKSLFMGVALSFFVTAFLFILGEDIPRWMTPDETLQDMLNSLIPMIGMANVFMIFGMIAWTLVGAQGRYRLATIVSACMSFLITLPLAAMSTFYFVFDLRGIVGAVICGYSTTGLCLGYILLRSDWEHISETIQEYNAEHDVSDSEDDSDSDSDSDSEDDSEDE